MDDDRPLLNDAVEGLMKATGRTRRQAEQRILQALKSGEVKAAGVNAATGEIEEIPVELFQSIPSEH